MTDEIDADDEVTFYNDRFEYKVIPINGLVFNVKDDPNSLSHRPRKIVDNVVIDGEELKPTQRFWSSLYSRFSLNKAFFRFFDHAEVFDRIVEKNKNDKIRVCIRRVDNHSELLAVTSTNRPVIVRDDLMEVLNQFRVEGNVRYSDGVITSTHTPKTGAGSFKIGGDEFQNKFVCSTPVDGFGQPNFFVSLLRLICSNGAVGWANAFKTTLQLGKGDESTIFTLKRALDNFSNDEGFAVMRSRFEVAQKSWTSIREQHQLYKILLQLQNDSKLRSGAGFNSISDGPLSGFTEEQWRQNPTQILEAYAGVTGNPYEIYFRDPDAMSEKRLRTLPVDCKVYDIINFATEVATHHVSEAGARTLQAWVGQMISKEFDLEGSCDAFTDFRDMFLQKPQ